MSFLQKKAELKEFWIDYFKFQIWVDRNKRQALFGLSVNSDFMVYDEFTYFRFSENWMYDCYITIVDKTTNINLWFFLINKKPKLQWNNYLKDYIEVTWQGLILRNIEYYYWMIEWFKFDVLGVSRVDIATDYIVNTDELCKNIFLPKLEKTTKHIFETKGIIETLYIWKKSKKENPYQIIRIYNKKLDSKVKQKSFLYEFEKDKDYTRIELEIREDKAKYINYKDLLSFDYLFVVYCRAIHRFSYDFFKKFTYDDFKSKSKTIKNASSLYFERLKRLKLQQESFDKFWSDFLSKEEEQQFLTIFWKKVKKLIKNKYSFRKFLFICQKYWWYEEEIKQYFWENKSDLY